MNGGLRIGGLTRGFRRELGARTRGDVGYGAASGEGGNEGDGL
jgi:hypothetical protein